MYPEPDSHQFADGKPKCVEYEPIYAIFQKFEPLFGSYDLDPDPHRDPLQVKIRIWIRVRVIRPIQIRINVMRIHNTVTVF
jgi:hypothetical protein